MSSEIPPSHAEQIAREVLTHPISLKRAAELIDAGLAAATTALQADYDRAQKLAFKAQQEFCTAVNQANEQEQRAITAEAHAAALADRLTRIEKITERWKDTAAAISADNAGHSYLSREEKAYSDGKIRALFSCAEQLCLALLALPQDGEAR